MNELSIKRDYLNYIKKKGRNLSALTIYAILFFQLLLIKVVDYSSYFGVPVSARDYLRTTTFQFYSSDQLFILVQDDQMAFALNLIYWVWNLSFLPVIMLLFIFGYKAIKKLPHNYTDQIIVLDKLERYLSRYSRVPSKIVRFKILYIAYKLALHRVISPIKYQLHTSPAYNWFNISSLDKDTRYIITTLATFKRSILRALVSNENIPEYLPPVQTLLQYFYEVAMRDDKYFQNMQGLRSSNTQIEIYLLKKFSREAREIIIKNAKQEIDASTKIKFFNYLKKYFRLEVIKFAIFVSIIAAVIMFLGVVFFSIDTEKAFLTWFVVSFTSLTATLITKKS